MKKAPLESSLSYLCARMVYAIVKVHVGATHVVRVYKLVSQRLGEVPLRVLDERIHDDLWRVNTTRGERVVASNGYIAVHNRCLCADDAFTNDIH